MSIMKPSCHFNGTSRSELYAQTMNAYVAIESAMDALRKASPHGRDYYPQGEDAMTIAHQEHIARLHALESIRIDLEEIALHVMPTR